MTMHARRKPVERRRVLLGGLAVLTLLGVIVLIGELLRHPAPPSSLPEAQLQGSDPRVPEECPQPNPREGDRRRPEDGRVIADVNSNDLYDCPHVHDGSRVRYRGEVVGGLLRRDIGVWTQLNDDVYAQLAGPLPAHRDYRGGNAGVGVLLPFDVAAEVRFVGGPQTRGDVLEVVGTFNRVDPTGEVAVIRADTAQLVANGQPFPDPTLPDRRFAALAAVVLACIVVVAERLAARQR